MSKPVRLSDEVYSRLENLTDGFDTPSDTIFKKFLMNMNISSLMK